MTAKYLITANGAVNWNATSSWSLTSGGSTGAAVPVAADDVFMDANSGSGTITVNVISVCNSINQTGFIGTLTFTTFGLSIGSSTVGATNIALLLVSGSTFNAGIATITFVSTSTTQQKITIAGKTLAAITFNGVGGSWQMQDSWTLSGNFTHTNGTVDWITNSVVITCTAASLIFTGGGKSYSSVICQPTTSPQILGSNTFTSLTITGPINKTCILQFASGTTQTISTLTINGNTSTNRLLIQSTIIGSLATLIVTTISSITNCDFRDIAAGGSANWNLAAITGLSGDCGGNSGITFTSPTTQICTMSTSQNWSTLSIWTSRIPLPQDNVSMSAITGGTLTIDMPRLGNNVNWTSATGSPTWAKTLQCTMYGTLTMISSMLNTGTTVFIFEWRNISSTFSDGGVIFTNLIQYGYPIANISNILGGNVPGILAGNDL